MQDSTLTENSWNPVNLGNKANGGYTITSQAVSNNWYERMIDDTGHRYSMLNKYASADMQSVEIARALDIIAEDVSAQNADNSDSFRLEYDNPKSIKKTQMDLTEAARQTWNKRTGFDHNLFNRVRLTLLMGSTFYYKNRDGTLTWLPSERFIGYVLSDNDRSTVTHYIYDEKAPLITDGEVAREKYEQRFPDRNREHKAIPVDDLLVMKIGSGPFGESLLARVYKTWRQMKLLEDSILIYRVTRAPERRVYYIDTGNLQGRKRDAAIEKQRIRLMQKRTSQQSSGSVESEYDPHAASEDIFIPTNSQGRGSRIETLQGGQNLGELHDLDWFYKKLAGGLRVPASMIDPYMDGGANNQYSDMRVGQTYQIEVRYMGHVKRLKRQINIPLEEHFVNFCRDKDINVPVGTKLVIVDSQSFSTYKQMEIDQMMLNIFNSTLQINQLSGRYALNKYLHFDEDELKENEQQKLIEKGISEETIKSMPEEHVSNLVYSGSPSSEILEKYGLSSDDEDGGGGGGFF